MQTRIIQSKSVYWPQVRRGMRWITLGDRADVTVPKVVARGRMGAYTEDDAQAMLDNWQGRKREPREKGLVLHG